MKPNRLSHLAGLLVLALPVQAEDAPLSAIDWLSGLPPAQAAPPPEPPITASGQAPDIEVVALDDTETRVTGIVPSHVTGLPQDLWRTSDGTALAARLVALAPPALPAGQALLHSLLLTETAPPLGDSLAFQAARLALLWDMGRLDAALALAETIGPDQSPALFARYFDLSLLAENADRPCTAIARKPGLAPDKAAEVFCTARNGDWPTAALLFGTADALGLLGAEKAEALARFLDPELFEGDAPLPTPAKADALMFVLMDALGQRPSVKRWPRVFAHADLTERVGWKLQLEAAERLAQTGAISENRLLGLYSDRRPAASGGLWDRVAAVQSFERALEASDTSALSKALPVAWARIKAAGLAVPFASLFAERLAPFTLSGSAADAAFEMLLLSPVYETAADTYPGRARARPVLAAVAAGDTAALTPESAVAGAITLGFAPSTAALAQKGFSGRLGEDILTALSQLEAGAAGDLSALSSALGQLRALGLEDTARRAALQILLSETTG